MKNKPKLVDHSLFKPIKKPLKIIPQKIIPQKEVTNEISSYFNWIGIVILFIFGYILYQRYSDKEKTELEKQNTIITFHQYINKNLKENK
jgi:hypothetical protein